MSAVFGLCQDKAARLADRPCPHRPAGRPQAGSQPGSPGEAKRGKGNTTAFPASVEIFGPERCPGSLPGLQ